MSFDHLTALKHTNTKQRVLFHREICVLIQICVQNENIWVFHSFSVYLWGEKQALNMKLGQMQKIHFAKTYYANK